MMDSVENAWQLFNEGKITYTELQEALKKILESEGIVQLRGFWQDLQDLLSKFINEKISYRSRMQYEGKEDKYFKRCDEVEAKIVSGSENLVGFWLAYPLKNPTSEEIENARKMNSSDVAKFFVLLGNSLKQLILADLETDPKTLALYEYYLLLLNEIRTRLDLAELPQQDGFLDLVSNKSTYKAIQQQVEQARETGSLCVHCGSQNVRSHGDKWLCLDCKRKFRKH
jgi:hypothetical protein